MSADILKEFLVAIGYEVDDATEKKLAKSLATVEKKAKDFSDGFEKREKERAKAAREANEAVARSVQGLAATVFGVMSLQRVSDEFARVTRQMEGLYYTAQRSGTAVGSIRGLSDAFERMGLQAQDAVGAVEGLARTMRTQPGARGLLASFGINPKGDQTENFLSLVEKLKQRFGGNEYGYATASRIAGERFGIPENVFFQAWNDPQKMRTEIEKSRKARGNNQDENADQFQKLSNQWRDFERQIETSITDFASKTAPSLTDALEAVNKKGLAPFVAALGTLLSTLVGGATLMSIGRLFGIGGPGAAGVGAAGVGAAGAAASGGLLSGLWKAAGRIAAPFAAGAAGQWLDEKTGRPGGNQVFADPKRMGEAVKRLQEDKRPWYQRAWDWATGKGEAGKVSANYPDGLAEGIKQTAADLGVDPSDVATAISYETAGTFDPWKKGPTTKWGEHRGLIQWGEPQREKYGVTKDMTPGQQMAAVTAYLKDAGVKPGMGLLDIYSAINAGGVGRYDRSDTAAGGALGTVADKVATMGPHRKKAEALLAQTETAKGSLWDLARKSLPGLPSFAAQAATFDKQASATPLAPSSSSASSDNSRSVTFGNTNITVHGSRDADMTAAQIGRQQTRLNQDLLSSVEGAVR